MQGDERLSQISISPSELRGFAGVRGLVCGKSCKPSALAESLLLALLAKGVAEGVPASDLPAVLADRVKLV